MDMVLAKSNIAIASRYAELVEETELREAIFSRLRAEWRDTIEMLLAVAGQQALLEQNPLLARSIRNRFPYLDPLNHVQIELLKRHRAGDTDERLVQGIHLAIKWNSRRIAQQRLSRLLGERHETSAPSISAPSGGHCRASGRFAGRESASLSGSPDHAHQIFPARVFCEPVG
jgi:hypothetical protein